MTVLNPSVEFERSWSLAKQRDDFATLTDLALDNYESGDAAPQWLRDEIREVCAVISQDLDENLDREDDGELGVFLIQLSSYLGPAGCMFAFLGLAYQCRQPGEQGGSVNPKIPGLLDSQLAMFDFAPRERWPQFVLGWREIAVRRVEILVRLDIGRQVNAMWDPYWEAVNMANLILVYEPATEYLNRIRSKLDFLYEARRTLMKYLQLLEHDTERKILSSDISTLEDMIDSGRRALYRARR